MPADIHADLRELRSGLLSDHCISCHGANGPESPALATLETIRRNSDAIDRSAAAGPSAVNTDMPEGISVPEAERRQLGEWLACGAPSEAQVPRRVVTGT